MNNNPPARIKKPPIMRVALIQIVAALFLSAVAAVIQGELAAYALLAGGMIQIIPNTWFAWFAFRYQGASQTRKIVASFYRGEAGKLLLSAAMFAALFVLLRELSPLLVMIGFIIAWLVGMVAMAKGVTQA